MGKHNEYFDDDFIRNALKLDIDADDELNDRILSGLDQRPRAGHLRPVLTAVICAIALIGSGMLVDAATGGRIINFVRGRIDNERYAVSDTEVTVKEITDEDGIRWEVVTFDEDKVSLGHQIPDDETSYFLGVKIEKNGMQYFFSARAAVSADRNQTTEDLYYAIRRDFMSLFTHEESLKPEILKAVREAAKEADSEAVRDALLDFAYDFENNRKVYIEDVFYDRNLKMGQSSWICEDLTDVESGPVAIITNSVYGREETYIIEITEYDKYKKHPLAQFYTDERLKKMEEAGYLIYDRRKQN